ncbi:MAG: 50S ribosomal protein L7/L12 [bacterium]|nr:50S ribosomal protein L7/L12 [bacterium]
MADVKDQILGLGAEEQRDLLTEVLGSLPVVRLNELVKHLEETWGVSAAVAGPVMMAGPGGGGGDDAGAAEAKTEFDVVLKEIGDSKLNVIKVVREITGLGIKEAKELVDAAPKSIKEKVAKAEADDMLKKLQEAGAVAELQ